MPIPSRAWLSRLKRSSPIPQRLSPPADIITLPSPTVPKRSCSAMPAHPLESSAIPGGSVLVADPAQFIGTSPNSLAAAGVQMMVAAASCSAATAPAPCDILDAALPSALASALSAPHVRIQNRERTASKLASMIAGGPDKLLVVSDFDHTMSRAWDERGERCWTTHGVFDNATKMPEVSRKCKALSEKYLPIEFDGKLSIAEKIPHMEEWWRLSHDAIVEQRVTREIVTELVRDSNIRLRDGATLLMKNLEAARVPLVMFSAGIGDIISVFLRQRLGAVPSNMHLISNMMQFDEKNEVIGFSEPLIHTFNKNGTVIDRKEEAFFHAMRQRDSVILMGDSMGDLHMDVGVENHRPEDTLKIAFLNQKPHLLPYYLEGYDIVIIDDQSMAIPNTIMDAIAKRL